MFFRLFSAFRAFSESLIIYSWFPKTTNLYSENIKKRRKRTKTLSIFDSFNSCDSCSKKISVPSVLSVWHQWSMDLSCFSSLFVPLRAISGRALSPSEFCTKIRTRVRNFKRFWRFFLLLSKSFAEDKQFSSSQKNQKNQIPCFLRKNKENIVK